MLAAIGVASIDELFADIPPGQAAEAAPRPAAVEKRARGQPHHARARREEPRRPRRSVLRRRRRLPSSRAGDGRPYHPALGVPHLLHALPAGDHAGHAAISVRVPDPGRQPDADGGRQRLHVRRLDRDRRGGADGASRHPAAQGGALRRPPSALPRDGRDGVAHGRRCDRRACARSGGHGGYPRVDRRRDLLRRRAVAVLLRAAHRPEADRRESACSTARCSSRSSPRSSRSA